MIVDGKVDKMKQGKYMRNWSMLTKKSERKIGESRKGMNVNGYEFG